MYLFKTFNKKIQKKLERYISNNPVIKNKFLKLKINPRKEVGAHPLYGKLKGKWSCWLSSNIRMIYTIADKNKIIIIEAVGTHKVY